MDDSSQNKLCFNYTSRYRFIQWIALSMFGTPGRRCEGPGGTCIHLSERARDVHWKF